MKSQTADLKLRFNDPGVMDKVMGFIVAIIGVGVALIIFGTFVGTVAGSITNSGLSGTNASIASTVTVVYIVGVVLATLGAFFFLFIRKGK